MLFTLVALMQRFNRAAYQAQDKQSILSSLNIFLDDSMVLPPGDFDQQTLMPILYMAKQKQRDKLLKKKQAEEDLIAKLGMVET